MPTPEFPPNLLLRLAEKSGFSPEDARRFLDAFAEVAEENEWPYRLPVHSGQVQAIVLPLVQQEHGKLGVNASPAAWPGGRPGAKPAAGPKKPEPPKPRDPGRRPPGAYPGPSVLVGKDAWAEEVEQAAAQVYPEPPIIRAGGAYPGPSITLSIHDPHDTGLHLGNVDLGNLIEAVQKTIDSYPAAEAVRDVSEGFKKAGDH